jgi:hypothetical protein
VTKTKAHGVLRVFPAKASTDSTTYLGHPMPKDRIFNRHYRSLVETIEGKISSWKLSRLSHVVRLILSKHVLLPIPIYSMGGTMDVLYHH